MRSEKKISKDWRLKMFDDFTQFKMERKQNIEQQGKDDALKKKANDFLSSSDKYKYSYNFRWMGLPIIQLPQDIIAMQEIIWDVKPDLIIETGVARGGSIVFYASMLELIGKGVVFGIDIDIREHNRLAMENHCMYKNVKLIGGHSSIKREVIQQIEHYIDSNKCGRVLVVLDSLHTHEHVLNELNIYSKFVTKGSYLVVFDTIIEDVETEYNDRPWGKGNNPKTAINEFLKHNDRFIVNEFIEDMLLITMAPSGYLKCVK